MSDEQSKPDTEGLGQPEKNEQPGEKPQGDNIQPGQPAPVQTQTVKFLKEYLPYAPGEVAGFPMPTASMLLAKAIAAFCDKDGNITQQPPADQAPVQSLQGPQPTAAAITQGPGFDADVTPSGVPSTAVGALPPGGPGKENEGVKVHDAAPNPNQEPVRVDTATTTTGVGNINPPLPAAPAPGDEQKAAEPGLGTQHRDSGDSTATNLPLEGMSADTKVEAPDQVGKDFDTGSGPVTPHGARLAQDAPKAEDEAKQAEESGEPSDAAPEGAGSATTASKKRKST